MESVIQFFYIAGIIIASILGLFLAVALGILGAIVVLPVVIIGLGWHMDSFLGGFVIFIGVIWPFIMVALLSVANSKE